MSEHKWLSKIGEDGTIIGLSFPILKHAMGTDWRDRSACAKLPKEVFFNYNSNNLEAPQRREHKTLALETCKSCPVIDKCFEFAICNNEQFGIWAGLTPDQRKPFVKRFRETGTLDSLPV